MDNNKSLTHSLSRIFFIALIANSILLVSLVVMGLFIRQSGIRQMHDMGAITLQAFKAVRPWFWNNNFYDDGETPPQLQAFVDQMAEQRTVQNVFLYDSNKSIIYSYKYVSPEALVVPPPERPVIAHGSLYIYSLNGVSWGRGGGGGHHGGRIPPPDIIIGIQLDASSAVLTARLRNVSFIIALLIEAVLLLFYRRLRLVIKVYDQSQESLRIAQQEATTGRLASILAHEIKNPLSSIKGLVGYAVKKSDDEKIVDNLNRSVGEVDRLTAIVNGFLSFGKPIELEKTKFSLKELCEKAMELLKHDTVKTGKSVALLGGDVTLNADYNKLLQVLVNLILNAVYASPEGGSVEIEIGDDFISITNMVQQGIDIDPERLFEPFYTTKTHGSGLGLAIARKITDLHGYKIEAVSTDPFKIRIRFSQQLPAGER